MIEIKDVAYAYGRTEVLKQVSMSVEPGDFVGILGNNGAGKSTLITCVNRIRKPKRGQIFIDGQDVAQLGRLEVARRIAYMGQKSELSRMTVFDAVLLGRKPYIKWAVSQEDMDLCEAMIAYLGLEELKLRNIDELSGGEVQKVMLARALVQEPELLLLDEPTNNLDPKNQHEVLRAVSRILEERHISAMMVIHDLNLALRYCNRFAFIHEGEVYRYGGEEIITPQTIRQVYGIDACLGEVDGIKVLVLK